MEPHPVERIGERTADARRHVVGLVAEIVVRALGVLVEGLFVVAVAWPHRRASVPTRGANATAAGVRPGSFRRLPAVLRPPSDARDWFALTDEPLPTAAAVEWATVASAGAVVTFGGVVRDHAEGRTGVEAMTYEAYERPAVRALGDIAAEIRRRWPEVARVVLLHRVGELRLSEASVVVVVSAPHRRAAFAAAEFAIDTLKESAPIWKHERWAGGSDWAVEQHEIRSAVGRSASTSTSASASSSLSTSSSTSER